jgi:hypothetical protein
MQFLYPYFLWALTALAIPVIIHLFYFRRFKKVYFSNVKYLKEIKEETSNRNKLKEWLILLSRLLAMACLIVAFAQPFIPKGEKIKSGKQLVSVFVDNSFSMTTEKEDIPLVDHAKERARQIIESYGEEAMFQIITHDLLGKHQRFLTREDALSYIDEIRVTSLVQPLSRILTRQYQLLQNGEGDKTIFMLSDFQKSIFDLETVKDSVADINLVPLQSNQIQNVSIDSVWMENQVALLRQPNRIMVRMTNHAPEESEQVRLSLFQDGQEKPLSIFSMDAGASRTDTIPVVLPSRGIHPLVFTVSDYPVQFDDTYYAVLQVPDTIIALNIYESQPNTYLEALFGGLSYFGMKNQPVSQIQYQDFSKYNLIILQDIREISSGLANELARYIREGGKVVLFPSTAAGPENYNAFLQSVQAVSLQTKSGLMTEVSKINTEEFIFKDVFSQLKSNVKLPKATESFVIRQNNGNATEAILTNRDGSIYLSKNKFGDGIIYVCSSSLSEEVNDLVRNAEIFVPMLYKMAISGASVKNIAYTIRNQAVIEIRNANIRGDQVYKMKGNAEFIPGQKNIGRTLLLDVGDQIRNAGFFSIYTGKDTTARVAFNYDRRESDLEMLTTDEMEDKLGDNSLNIRILSDSEQEDMKNTITIRDKGIALWKYFLLAVLFFLFMETLLIRLWR